MWLGDDLCDGEEYHSNAEEGPLWAEEGRRREDKGEDTEDATGGHWPVSLSVFDAKSGR